MPKLSLSDVSNLTNQASAIGTINENMRLIEAAVENTISRDGTVPNNMDADFDMNEFRILNLPEPQDGAEPLRLMDADMVLDSIDDINQAVIDTAASAAAAALSAANALTSENNAETAETNAEAAAADADADRIAAEAARVGAETAETNAETAETNAETAATTATTQAGVATTQAGIATTQAGIATTQAGTATTQAGIATTAAGNAQTAETNAETAETGAEAARDAAETFRDEAEDFANSIDPGSFATAAQGLLADSAVQPGDLATVATTGDYSDLINVPAIIADAEDVTYNNATSGLTATDVQAAIDELESLSGGGGREILSADRTYYVRSDGSDSNTGLVDSAGGAFLTMQYAVDLVLNTLEPLNYAVTIQVGAATRTAGVNLNQPWRGSNFLWVIGDTTTPSNCTINTTSDDCFAVTRGCSPVIIQGFRMTTTTSGSCIRVWEAGSKVYYGFCEFGSCAAAHIDCGLYGEAVANWNYTINGSAVSHFHTGAPGMISSSAITVTLTGTPAFSAYFAGTAGGFQVLHPITFSGSATGKRFVSHKGGVIDAQGKTATFLPGSTAGTTDTGGEYVTGSGAKPLFQAHKNSVNQTGIVTATFTKVTYDTEAIDVGGYYDTTNSRWTPPAGRYKIDVFIQYTAGIVSGFRGAAVLYKNGTGIGTSIVHFSSTAGSSVFLSKIVEANGTDYFEGWCYADGTGNKSIDGNPNSTFFQGHWLGDL